MPEPRALSFATSGLRRGWFVPELVILALAIAVAVAASSAVSLFADRVSRALLNQTGEAFGADAALTSRNPLPPDLLRALAATGTHQTSIVQFPSVAVTGNDTALVSVKAAAPGYPLRGALRTTAEPFGAEQIESGLPAAGEAWVDLRLWQDLKLQAGSTVQLGTRTFRVARILSYEPDRSGGFAELAPRVLIGMPDLASTGLVGPGSRVSYTEYLSGDEAAIARVRTLQLPPGVKMQTPEEARPQIRNALRRALRFLDIAVLAAMLLAGSAIAVSGHQHGLRLRDEAALFKVLGATSRLIATRSLVRLLALALGAGIAGLVLGTIGQAAVAGFASGLLEKGTVLPPPRPLGALWSLGLTLILVLGFAAPPWLAARRTPPVRVFQRNVSATGSRAAALIAAAAAMLLVGAHTGDTRLAGIVLGGAIGAAALLGAAAWLLVAGLARLRARGGAALRFGLANIARRRTASVGQAVALGIALLALLLLAVVHRELLDAWRERLPPDTPNQFLINIQPEQVGPLTAFLAARGIDAAPPMPMTRGRLVAVGGRPVDADTYDDPDTRRWIDREFNLTWTDRFGDDNRLVDGRWWDESARGKPWLSIDVSAQERLHLKVGDVLRLQVADRTVELEVRNVRKVNWDSFRPNFFLATPPGVLDGAPTQWITSFHLPADRRPVLRELIGAFPNVTAFDLDAVMSYVRNIVDRVVDAVEFMLLFTLAAGLTVLLAAIEGTRAERVRETALLRALGAGTRTIALGLIAEYAVLGLVAGVVASAAAQAVGWGLATYAFELPYRFSPALWIVGTATGGFLVPALGWVSLRRTLGTPPRSVLAATG